MAGPASAAASSTEASGVETITADAVAEADAVADTVGGASIGSSCGGVREHATHEQTASKTKIAARVIA